MGQLTTGGQLPTRTARPLGRGLEEISHLFLSTSVGAGAAAPGEPEPPAARPPARASVALRRGEPLTTDQVVATLRDDIRVLGEGLRVIDGPLACPPLGDADLLVIDETNRLAIVDVELTAADTLLVRGLGHVDWVIRNSVNLDRMYPALPIDFARAPRLFLVGLQFSPRTAAAVRQLGRSDTRCFKCHGVALGSGTGIFFEPVLTLVEE